MFLDLFSFQPGCQLTAWPFFRHQLQRFLPAAAAADRPEKDHVVPQKPPAAEAEDPGAVQAKSSKRIGEFIQVKPAIDACFTDSNKINRYIIYHISFDII